MSNKTFEQIWMETAALCNTPTHDDDNTDRYTRLRDWMEQGRWNEQTPAGIAAEWDELSNS